MSLDDILAIPDDYSRVHCALHDWVLGSGSDVELADTLGVAAAFVRRVRREILASDAIREMVNEAKCAVREIGLSDPTISDCVDMIGLALREYAAHRPERLSSGTNKRAGGSAHLTSQTVVSEPTAAPDDTSYGGVSSPSSTRRGLARSASRVDHRVTDSGNAVGGQAEG